MSHPADIADNHSRFLIDLNVATEQTRIEYTESQEDVLSRIRESYQKIFIQREKIKHIYCLSFILPSLPYFHVTDSALI